MICLVVLGMCVLMAGGVPLLLGLGYHILVYVALAVFLLNLAGMWIAFRRKDHSTHAAPQRG
ncbi:hypothetical protein HYW67_00940 [Candidatus Parcubacteria bacterium]|nr:hypothetical protein [Candidatus Parcubacteria bacterium]